jgi:streptomycin 6-kinase
MFIPKIRDEKLSDLNNINDLLKKSKASWGYDDHFMDEFMRNFSTTSESIQKNVIKLFFNKNQLISFYAFSINKNDDIQLYLDDFFVHPDYIGQGIGKIMWNHCLDTVTSIGQTEFWLWADPNAAGFYKKCGCIQTGIKESPVVKGRFTPIFIYKL